jgi:hypothetical protein
VNEAALWSKSRMVEIPGLGALVFTEPTLADVSQAPTNPYWWVRCITRPDGSPLLANAQDAGKIRAELAAELLQEVNRTRPTEAPSEGSGASHHPSNV